MAARNAAEDPSIHTVDADANEVIKLLEGLQARVSELYERAKRYNRYQEMLRMQVCSVLFTSASCIVRMNCHGGFMVLPS